MQVVAQRCWSVVRRGDAVERLAERCSLFVVRIVVRWLVCGSRRYSECVQGLFGSEQRCLRCCMGDASLSRANRQRAAAVMCQPG